MNFYQGIIFCIVICFIFALSYGRKELRKHYLDKMAIMLVEGDLDQYNAYCNKLLVKLLFTQYNSANMRLNAALLQNDEEKIESIFKEFLLMNDISQQQKEEIYLKAFNYYMSKQNYEKANVYKEVINKQLRNPEIKEQTQIIYDIYANKSAEHIDKLLKQNEEVLINGKGFVEMLISDSYRNKCDLKNAEKYKKMSLEHYKQLENAIRKEKQNAKQ